MTAYEIYKEINTASQPEYYEMANLMEYDIEGASKLIQEYFKCNKETADESIAIMNKAVEDGLRSKGIEPLTREQMNLNNERERLNRIAQQNKPKCPTCQSTNLKKISTTSKVVNTAVFGIFGTKRHKTFHCNNCGYEW
ncbi:MAG: hypothetical protein HDR11_03210 [Lachnospiraceae bacterium]|nr:hypothetical protein [Lachnospiraceae bacterium]